jgi:hypothetical protein
VGTEGNVRSVYRARDRREAEERLAGFLGAVDRAQLRPFDAFAKRITQWHTELLAYFDEPTTNGYAEGVHQQGQGDQAPRLRTTHLQRLPQARRHSLWLTGQHDATPLNQREPKSQPVHSEGCIVNRRKRVRFRPAVYLFRRPARFGLGKLAAAERSPKGEAKRLPGDDVRDPIEGVGGGGMTHQPAGRSVPSQGSVSRRRPRMPP